jgi:photosystem II stability/assembly factor-like uncharacterized protein
MNAMPNTAKPFALATKALLSLLFVVLLSSVGWMIKVSQSKKTTDSLKEQKQSERGSVLYPSEWAWIQRTFPYLTADPTAHVQALQRAQALRHLAKASTLTPKWKLAGPTNIGGRISALAFNPKDSKIVYAGACTGGVFKSTDRGVTWKPIFDDQAVLPIGDIAVDPIDPNVIYAGTGEANGGHNNFPGAGVFKSTDAGASWKLIGLEATTSIGRIVIDPTNSNRVYVAAIGSYFGIGPERGVYRSANAGQSWEKVLFVNDSTGAIDLVIDPQNPQKLFAAAWERVRPPKFGTHLNGRSSGIYRSLNGGDTWQLLGAAQGLPAPRNNVGRIGLAICVTKPDHLYALYTNNNSNGYTYDSLYRSKDGGSSWQRINTSSTLNNGFSNFSWYFGNVRVHPADPERVYVLDFLMMISANGGLTWSSAGTSHVDHHALAFDPLDPQRQIVGHDGGIDYSANGGATWTKVAALPVTQFYHITMDQTLPERLYGGTQDNGTVRTTSGGLDDWGDIYGGDGFYVIVDPTNSNVIYAESQYGFLGKSTNGGFTFTLALNGIDPNEPTDWSTPVVMDPNNSQVLYYGTNRVYRTANGAGSWEPICGDLTDSEPGSRLGTVTTIAVAPSNSAVIYAGTDDSHVWVTANTGQTWTEISETLPYRWVTRVAVDPKNAQIAYVTFSGLKWNSPQAHVFRTTDMGLTWQDISGNLPDAPVNTIVVDPAYPRFLYIGTDVGAYYSSNSGQSWSVLGEGLPLVSVYDIAIHPARRFLAAGTHGRSMYTLDLSTLVEVDEPITQNNKLPSSPILAQNYPNPFNPQTSMEFVLPASKNVMLNIYNLNGQRIRTLVNEPRQAGRHVVHWNGLDEAGREAASGSYLYRLQVGTWVRQKKMTLVR